MRLESSLQNLGLNSKQTSVYLALLELGEAAVLKIAKQANIKRPTTYVVLKELEKKGFVSKLMKARTTLYTAEHPRKLLTEAELKLTELKQVVPQLESLLDKSGDKPKVKIYEGEKELDRAYDESFIVKGEVLYMSTLELSQAVFKRTFKKMDLVPLSADFRMRELVDDSELGRKYSERIKNEYRQIKFIPKEFLPFEIDIGIFGNIVLISSLQKEYFTISIQSPEINCAFRMLFETMWRQAKE